MTGLPDPSRARTLDELVDCLRSLKVWAGDPSFQTICDRVNAAWTAAGRPAGELARRGTVVDCFKLGRRRFNTELVVAVVGALHPEPGYVAQWNQALRVVLGEARATAQVRVQDTLPADLADFTGRAAELDRLRHLLRHGRDAGGPVVISAIEGMAGVGKTGLAVHAGHLLAGAEPFEQVLFVNLRGFHPDPAQPPADPAAVLDGFLRLLGVPGQQIPHDLTARGALFRRRLTGRRALVVLDNAADEDQVRPLLPDSPGCVTIVTSRRHLAGLHPTAAHLALDVFTPDEAVQFLTTATHRPPVGDDPDALDRIAHRCGCLPLALGLVAAKIRTTAGWTATDHADRLDERHEMRRLDSGVELALSLSYQQLPVPRRRLFRLLALHPGHDLDPYAAAALADTDLDTAHEDLRQLCADHLLQQPTPGRYVFHDLVRAYATDRTMDEDRPPDRRAALARLLDHYLYAAATAMDALHPAERNRRPRVTRPTSPTPPAPDATTARGWLDTERTNLITTAVHAAAHGWLTHTTLMGATLHRYLDYGSHFGDAIVLNTHAARAATESGDREANAHALTNLGSAHGRLGRFREAADHHEQALVLFHEIGDLRGQARTFNNLGTVLWCLGSYREAADRHGRAVTLYHRVDDSFGEALASTCLGNDHSRLGDDEQAVDCHRRAVDLFREIGDRFGEGTALNNLGAAYERLGRYDQAAASHGQALAMGDASGHPMLNGYGWNGLGFVDRRRGAHRRAADHHRRALDLFREIGDRFGEAGTLNALGTALLCDGEPDEARTHHSGALALANEIGDRYEQARAHDGLARTFDATGDPEQACRHWRHALTIYTDLGVPEADQIRVALQDRS